MEASGRCRVDDVGHYIGHAWLVERDRPHCRDGLAPGIARVIWIRNRQAAALDGNEP
ncbi:MAG: hypothetical protein M0030_27490 [Actinomycetota bacterium]|nr:hypothetical protein [Actinomycetota bacterium]